MAITQVITTLPAAPDPVTMTRDQFSAAAAASVLAQKAMVPEINAWTAEVNAIVEGAAGDIASGINGAAAKTTPVDADLLTLTDSAASFVLKKFTWANLKTTLASTFSTLTQLAATGGAALVGNTPAGSIAATTVQAALNELDTEKAALAGSASQVFSVSPATVTTQAPATSQIVGALGAYSTASGHTAGIANANTYTNTTGRPLWVTCSAYSSDANQYLGYINGAIVQRADLAAGTPSLMYLLVPPGATYAVGFSSGTITNQYWNEY